MKEYKVVTQKATAFNTDWQKRYEDFLNQHAREGWIVCEILQKGTVVFERDKNR